MQKNEKTSTGERINDFIQKNRKPIFIFFGVIILLFAGSVAAFSLIDVFRKKAISEVEELSRRYEQTFSEDAVNSGTDALLADLETFAKKHSGFAGGRAWSIIARIYADRKEWSQAETAWRNAAARASKTYLGPVSLFNAAVAAEEQGKNADAIDLYAQSASHPVAFPAAPHAQFAIGRLNEALNNRTEAIEAYRLLLAKWPNVSVWASLAHSRIIALETGIQ
jgi:predicted negative regulator of RcsB-dependent stress response